MRSPAATLAAYFVHWTPSHAASRDPSANFDLILGAWGESATAADRVGIALEYRLIESGPAFRVIDAAGRPIARSDLVGRTLMRREALEGGHSPRAFEIADAVLEHDARVLELLGKWRLR